MPADPAEKYVRAAVLAANSVMVMVRQLTTGQPQVGRAVTYQDAVTIVAAAVPAIMGEILGDPEVMEPEGGQEGWQ